MKKIWWMRTRKKALRGNRGQQEKALFNKLAILWLTVMGMITNHSFSQNAEYVFNPGERVTYGAYYNWHFIWLHAGEVNFTADTITEKDQRVLDLKAIGSTFKAYDLFYTVRDTFESRLTFQEFSPIHFRRVMNHGKKHSEHKYSFDPSAGKVYTEVQRDDEDFAVNDTLEIKRNTFDLLSTAYYFRSFDYKEMKKGELVRFKMLVDNQVEDIYFRYLGEEEVKTREGEKFWCNKISVMLLEGDFFPKGEHMKVWFTNDRNKIPVMVETEIAVGFVKAILTGYSDLKYPLTSKILNDGKH